MCQLHRIAIIQKGKWGGPAEFARKRRRQCEAGEMSPPLRIEIGPRGACPGVVCDGSVWCRITFTAVPDQAAENSSCGTGIGAVQSLACMQATCEISIAFTMSGIGLLAPLIRTPIVMWSNRT